MKSLSTCITGAAAVALLATAPSASAESLAGRWDASVTINGTVIPFRLDLSADGPEFRGTLFNGDETQTTTFASHSNSEVVLRLDHYLTNIIASERNGELVGKVQMRNDKDANGSAFRAVRYVAPSAAPANLPLLPTLIRAAGRGTLSP